MNDLVIADTRTSFEAFKELLQSSPQAYLLLKERPQELLEDAVLRAIEALHHEVDLAAIGYCEGEAEPWDVGAFVDFDGVIFRKSVLLELVQSGYRPLYSCLEFPQAVRHAGWRVQATGRALLRGPRSRENFHQGRLRQASELYDSAVEQILARGPRLFKRTWAYALCRSVGKLRSGHSLAEEAGAVWQALLAALQGSRQNLAQGAWRKSSLSFSFPEARGVQTAVVLFTALRPWYLRRALRALHRHWPQEQKALLIVSQDGSEPATTSLIESLGKSAIHYHFTESVDVPLQDLLKGWTPYYRIARHYGYALHRVFADESIQEVIVLEDDLEIGPDFFNYLHYCRRLLKENQDLLAASAWNDHGMLAEDPQAIRRTDCFPGYGWLLTRSGWESIAEQWPATLWDEWMREPEVLGGRQFLQPELSRVRNFGRSGTGSAQFFDRYIAPVKLQESLTAFPEAPIDFSLPACRERLRNDILQSKKLRSLKERSAEDCYLVYRDESEFREMAEKLGILPEFRPQAPRSAFEGVVSLRLGAHQLFLVPEAYWQSRQSKQKGL